MPQIISFLSLLYDSYPEMKITKKKNPQASLQIFYSFLNPHTSLWIFFIGNYKAKVSSLLVCGFFFFLRFLKSIGWYGFPMDFLVVLNLLLKLESHTNFKFDKRCIIKDHLWKHISIIGWCLVCQRNPYRLGPMDLKIFTLAKNPRL